jgi:hypothetical protein
LIKKTKIDKLNKKNIENIKYSNDNNKILEEKN